MEEGVRILLRKQFRGELLEAILKSAIVQEFEPQTEILREGQFVKAVPLVISGLVKVYTRFNDKELLLYYIQANESCIMSFSSGIRQEASKVFAITEEPSQLLLLPISSVMEWIKQFPEFNDLFFQYYNQRYYELLESIHQLLFNKMDSRVLDFLRKRQEMAGTPYIKLSHSRIANELGTAREVISRVIKRLETEGALSQTSEGIAVLQP